MAACNSLDKAKHNMLRSASMLRSKATPARVGWNQEQEITLLQGIVTFNLLASIDFNDMNL